MKRALPAILDTVHTLALACWLFGLFVIVAIVAPAAARIPGATSLHTGLLVAESLYRFGAVLWICGLLMLGAQFVLRRRYRRDRALFIGDGVRQLLTFGALLLAEQCRDVLIPTLQAAGNAGNAPKFDHFQHLIASVTLLQMALLIAIGTLTAWLQWPRPVVVPASASSTTAPQKPVAAPPPSRRTTR